MTTKKNMSSCLVIKYKGAPDLSPYSSLPKPKLSPEKTTNSKVTTFYDNYCHFLRRFHVNCHGWWLQVIVTGKNMSETVLDTPPRSDQQRRGGGIQMTAVWVQAGLCWSWEWSPLLIIWYLLLMVSILPSHQQFRLPSPHHAQPTTSP